MIYDLVSYVYDVPPPVLTIPSTFVPDFVSEPDKPATSSYFSSEEDNIMNGVPTTNDNIKIDIDKQANDISRKINESAYFMDLIDQYFLDR